MGNSLVKASTQQEARHQMLSVDKSLADTVTRRLEIEDRRKEIMARWRETKEFKELKAMAKEEKALIVIQHEQTGARKMIFQLFKKFGLPTPESALTKLVRKNEEAREMISA